MTAKEWLGRGWKLDREIKELEEMYERELAKAMRTTSGASNAKVQESIANRAEDRNIAVSDYALSLKKKKGELDGIKLEIFTAVHKLSNSTYRRVLVKRYLNFQTWERIAQDMGYSVRHVIRLHDEALKRTKMSLNVT